MTTTAKQQFENELNERMAITVKTMMENKQWQEIFSHLSQEQIIDTIAIAFLTTNIKEGSEKAFINACRALNK